MKICKGDRKKITFYTRYGYLKYQGILFSIFDALTSVQGYINGIQIEKLNVFDIVYLDDILIYINKTDHINTIYISLISSKSISYIRA